MNGMIKKAGAIVFFGLALLGFWVGASISPTYTVETVDLTTAEKDGIILLQTSEGPLRMSEAIPLTDSQLMPLSEASFRETPEVSQEVVHAPEPGLEDRYIELRVVRHFGIFSLLPAVAAVLLCFLLKEPVVALFGGIVTGRLILAKYDIAGAVLIPAIGTSTGATILVLYLWFLGGLMGIWSRNGAAGAFAVWVTTHFVRGPRGAKLVSWLLGAAFFQGGTMSTVLVGTTVKPIADKQKVSHEELAYVVDSTAAPIAVILPFNAWPIYVQAFLFVAGVPFLVTEADRIAFFFANIPLYFYAWLAVLFTLLLSFDKLPFLSPRFRAAIKRSRETGALDAPDAEPLSAKELQKPDVAPGYRPHMLEFLIPLALIIGITVGTYIFLNSPQVLWGFGAALFVAFVTTLARGMSLKDVMAGFINGLKGVVYGSVVLLLAVVVGGVSREVGAGPFLVEQLGGGIPYWLLPVALVILTMIIAFSTGTSWGTFAVTLPLAMPLAWAIAGSADLANPTLYMGICFAAVINGSVFGDQCSPISDTTVLSCMATGCDLMDHVRTQIFPCLIAMAIALVMWVVVCITMAA